MLDVKFDLAQTSNYFPFIPWIYIPRDMLLTFLTSCIERMHEILVFFFLLDSEIISRGSRNAPLAHGRNGTGLQK